MRHWLVVLMILFTPLRGLAADVMAIAMAAQQSAPAHHNGVAVAAPQVAEAAAMSDCAEHHALTADTTQPQEDVQADLADGDCPTCASCMVCSASALAMHNLVPAAMPLHHGLPVPRLTSFSSAAPLPGFKPPIS
jgi:hypothetical protein